MTFPPPYKTRATKTRQPKFKNTVGLQPIPGGLATTKQGPRYRGPETDARKAAYQLMRELSLAAKYLTPRERAAVEEYAKGTQLLWRDVVFQLLTGRFWTFWTDTGLGVYSVASQADVSQLIDAITQLRGALLYRGPNLWEPVLPGLPGNVLTSQGENSPPVFAPAATASTLAVTTVRRTTNTGSSSVWPRTISWEDAPIDDNGAWDPANPDRIYIPQGVKAIRLSYSLRFSASTGFSSRQEFIDPAGAVDPQFGGIFNTKWGSSGFFSSNELTGIGPWIPPPAVDYVRLQVDDSAADTMYVASYSFCTLETLPLA